MSDQKEKIVQNQIVEIEITDLAFDGKSVGQVDGKIYFLDAGLPGETVRAEITRRKPRYNYAHVSEILVKSPDRIYAPCPHFDICGGCTWQDLNYEKQLYFKRKQVVDCLRHIGHLDSITVDETLGSSEQFFYRNKMEFSMNSDSENGFVLGLHRRGHYDKIFDVENCLLQAEISNRIAVWFRRFIRENEIPVYDVNTHAGFVRFLVIRDAKRTNQIMLNIVTAEGEIPNRENMLADIKRLFPEVTTVAQNINTAKANIARGESELILHGPGYIEEKLFDYTFRIYPNSFFQTNTLQAEKLYSLIYEILKPQKDDCLLDLYCGAGAIGICASGLVSQVIGVELEPSAIRAASENAALNGIKNITFHTASVQDMLLHEGALLKDATCAVLDPPRAGLHPKALRKIAALSLPRLVYVSCNPGTFARDASYLVQEGYKITRVAPVDMFPHTMHIELVAGFIK